MAMRYLDEDRPYQKIWYELQALAWNRPELRERVDRVNGEWRVVLTEALAEPRERYGIETPLDALVSLVVTFNEGIILERLSGIDTGHGALLDWIDAWLEVKERDDGDRRDRDPRAVARPLPRRRRLRRARRRAHRTGSSTARASRRCCSYRRGRSCTRGSGSPRSRTSPGTSASSRSTRAATGAPTARRNPRRTPRPSTRRMHSPSSTRPVPSARSSSRCRAARSGRSSSPTESSRARRRAVRDRAGAPARASARGPRLHSFDDELDTRRGLGEVQPPLLAPRLRGLPRVLLRERAQRAALDQADRGRRRLGSRNDAGHARRDRARTAAERGDDPPLAARVRCPVLVVHGDRDRIQPHARGAALAEATGGDARRARGLRVTPARRATRCRSTCSCASFDRSAGAARAALDARRSRGAAARSTSRRRSGSAMRGATSRSPTSCGRSSRTSRSTGSRSTR